MNRYAWTWLYRGVMAVAFVAAIAVILWARTAQAWIDESPSPLVPEETEDEPEYRDWSPVVQLGEFCTGFYVGDKRILTAGHCVIERKSPIRISFDGGSSARADVLAASNVKLAGEDWALLEVQNDYVTKQIRPLKLDCDYEPVVGADLRIQGYPEDLGFLTVWGQVVRGLEEWGPFEKPVFGIAAPISYGNSGSPVISESSGEVVGIAVGALPNNRSLAAAQPLGPVCKVMGMS